MGAILKRELKCYFLSPIGYVFTGMFILMNSFFFVMGPLRYGVADLKALFSNSNMVFMFLISILTMRLLSEERNKKTDQLLLTAPIKIYEIVLGKYFAAVCVFFIALIISFCLPITLFIFGNPSFSECIGGYFGFILLWASLISVGIFISSITENQIVSAVLTFAALKFISLFDYMAANISNDIISGIVSSVSFYKRYSDFESGILSISGVVFFISVIFVFLFLTVKMIERRRYA